MDRENVFIEDSLEYFDTSMLDSSLLELLCEDGFLEFEEIAAAETPQEQEALLRCAVERGFPYIYGEEYLDVVKALIEKKLDVLQIWKDITDDDKHLRAPPWEQGMKSVLYNI